MRLTRQPRSPQQRPRAKIEAMEQRLLLTSIVVNTLSDAGGLPNGVVSLRAAVNVANSSTTPTTITFNTTVFSSNKTIVLTNGALDLNNTREPITISGPSYGVTVSGNNRSGVFFVGTQTHVTLSQFTVTQGSGFREVVTGSTGLLPYGGGIFNNGYLTLTNSTVSGNGVHGQTGTNGNGGGIYNNGTAILTNDTVSGNQASNDGGGVYNHGNATLVNDTLAQNLVDNVGGGLCNDGTATLTNVTIAANNSGVAGGIANTPAGHVTLGNCLLAGNSGASGDIGGTVNSLGYNLISIAVGAQGLRSTDLTGGSPNALDPKLGPLAYNGGATQNMLPRPGSPAIDAGSKVLIPSGTTTDQRGNPRVVGSSVDIGAVEVLQTITLTPPPIIIGKPWLGHSAVAGQSTSFGLGSFTQTFANPLFTVDVNWGDGSAHTKFTVGAAGTLPIKNHTYTALGTKTVSVMVTDSAGYVSNRATFNVTVSAPPIALSGTASRPRASSATIWIFRSKLTARSISTPTADRARASPRPA